MDETPEEEWQVRDRRTRRWLKRAIVVTGLLALVSWGLLLSGAGESCAYVADEIAKMAYQMACTADLLKGDIVDKALFVWLWAIPLLLVGAGVLRVFYEVKRLMR